MSDVQPAHGNGGTGERAAPAPVSTQDAVMKEFAKEIARVREESSQELRRAIEVISERFENENLAAKREAIAYQESQAAAKEKADQKKRWSSLFDRIRPILFIVLTLIGWRLIILLAIRVLGKLPGISFETGIANWTLVIVSFVAAVFASKTLVARDSEFS
jgi:hypothetical protein